MKNDGFFTKQQMEKLMHAWGVSEQEASLPCKGKHTILSFPPTELVRVIRITIADVKSTDNKTLYRVQYGDTLEEIMNKCEITIYNEARKPIAVVEVISARELLPPDWHLDFYELTLKDGKNVMGDSKYFDQAVPGWRRLLRARTFKVAAISSNANSFGLTGHVLIATNGEAWEVGRNTSIEPLKVGDTVTLPINEEGTPTFAGHSFEIPRKLDPSAPAAAVCEIWLSKYVQTKAYIAPRFEN